MNKKIMLVVTAVLFLGALLGVRAGFSVPTEREEIVTHFTYNMEGNFSHQAFGKPPAMAMERLKPNPRYFIKIIEGIDVNYSYSYVPEKPVLDLTETVAINAIVEAEGNWEKELQLVKPVVKKGDFTISLPLDMQLIRDMASLINKEIGLEGGTSVRVTLKAMVHTEAWTEKGTVEDDFIQTTYFRLTGTTVEWDRNLVLSRVGYARGFTYAQQGNFGYTVNLKDNSLYTVRALQPEIPPPVTPVALPPADSYPGETTQKIQGTFTYKFQSDKPLDKVTNEVEITAAVGKGGWRETFALVPKSQKTGDLNETFTIDLPFFYAVIRHNEKAAPVFPYELLITANVNTVADSRSGQASDTFTQSLKVQLGSDKVTWTKTEPAKKEGSLQETVVTPNSSANTAKLGSLGALGMTVVALMYAAYSYWEARRRRLTRIEADALYITSKHRDDLVVDVAGLPGHSGDDTLIEMGSLGELIKVADGLFKPVLRLREPEKHTYCVIDGTTRYQYDSKSEELAAPMPARTPPTEEAGPRESPPAASS